QLLNKIDRLSLNDISDGLSSELNEIAKASNVSIMINDKDIPVNKELKKLSDNQQIKYKYSSGEDFELVGTTSKKNWNQIKQAEILVTKIGQVVTSTNERVFVDNYNQILKSNGYIHLK